jgi:hypothetical protein
MRTIIINSSNFVPNSNNKYVYNLPISWKTEYGDQVGVSGVSLYNSTFNITNTRGNNTITFIFLGTSYTFTFPNGYYAASDMNYFLQQQCILNNLYLTSNSGSTNIYFIEITQNSIQYAISLNFYPIPTSAQSTTLGYSKPSGATWSYPSVSACPQAVITAPFGLLIGQLPNTYPPTTSQTTAIQYLSTITPTISPVDSYIITCSLINSPYSNPNNSLFSIPLNASLGKLISSSPSQIVFNDVAPNIYNSITVQFYDQLFNTLYLNDYELVLTLVILEAKERKMFLNGSA